MGDSMNVIPADVAQEVEVPFGHNKLEQVTKFERLYGGFESKTLYKNGSVVGEGKLADVVEEAFSSNPDKVLIGLFGNAYGMGDGIYAYVLTSNAAWKKLTGELKMYPKMVILINWYQVKHLVTSA
jgi:hypothetical protein